MHACMRARVTPRRVKFHASARKDEKTGRRRGGRHFSTRTDRSQMSMSSATTCTDLLRLGDSHAPTDRLGWLKRMHEKGCPWDEDTCRAAAENGHLECLKFLHENGCPWDESVCRYAAFEGQLECLKYAHENGCEWNSRTCYYASSNGQIACLKYAHEHGCPWDEQTCADAAESGHLECLRYAHLNGCEWDQKTCDVSVERAGERKSSARSLSTTTPLAVALSFVWK